MADTMADAGPNNIAAAKKATAKKWMRRTSTLGLILMGLATLGSSWCSYQSSLWDGIQTFKLMDSASLSRSANEMEIRATQQRGADGALFVEYARDINDGKTGAAEFIFARMRPGLKNAISAWMATQPLKNPDAPATPFVMAEYQVPFDSEAAELASQAATAHNSAQEANRTSDSYTLLTVLYATALFLAGLVSAIPEWHARLVTLIMGAVMFAIASALLFRLPIAQIG
jgi:hypothetical protein